MRSLKLISIALVISAELSLAQLPQAAQTDLYFPHLADGGPASAQWQTRFTLINPNATGVTAAVFLYADNGSPLVLDLGNGLRSQFTVIVPANGTIVLPSRMASATTVTGWAYIGASQPLLANVAFRLIQNGAARVEITAEPTLPSTAYRAVATPQVGVAVANIYPVAINALVTVSNASGNGIGQAMLTIPANGHTSFNLWAISGLPATFTGNVIITPQTQGQDLIAWAVYADSSGVISSLPDGRAGAPLDQVDQIYNAFYRVYAAYQALIPNYGPMPTLVVSPDAVINSFASGGNTVQINLAFAELISDSPSELGHLAAHEMAHIYQQRNNGLMTWSADPEWDADQWGLLASLTAGYDPYAAAGWLGKVMMATNQGSLINQIFDNLTDVHGSAATRIDNLGQFVQGICSSSATMQTACARYKAIAHPHFPNSPYVPLSAIRSLAHQAIVNALK